MKKFRVHPPQEVVAFLSKVPGPQLEELERMGPEFTWALRSLYGPAPTTIEELARVSGWSWKRLSLRRDEALYILGYFKRPSAEVRSFADTCVQHFRIRQKLYHLRQSGKAKGGDAKVADLLLKYGVCPAVAARKARMTANEIFSALRRMVGLRDYQVVQHGQKIRRYSLRDVRASGENHKIDLERRVLTELYDGLLITQIAGEWEMPAFTITAVVAEIRRELSHGPTADSYARLDANSHDRRRRRRKQTAAQYLNAHLLPIYERFREQAEPFSLREQKFMQARIKGASLPKAARETLNISREEGSVYERALLGLTEPLPPDFPGNLPLPPFTSEQEELMKAIQYCRMNRKTA